ncbi:hypothetical protein BC477_04220 [Clavibacter michiganensis subsp. michiganensis]|uniref:Uncharacterized protein n=1 Tax=Clavibacter michiganensis subsp. michiganensis TaxID=33013 RepID=A0A251XLJ0_CLAMM|nr:hypothetical protein BC477_04220 [Clavibacter michiganensis subsp. michiganensis]OUE03918.1 hypothetical protein CMMCAS07_03155 [Clavibacter michiganensis subsp. michiganensis]
MADDASRLTIESFERTALLGVRAHGIAARLVYLLEGRGAAIDEVARNGDSAVTFEEQLTDAGLASLAAEVDGISVGVERICPADGFGSADEAAPVSDLVERAHRAGLSVFTWTLRPRTRSCRDPSAGPVRSPRTATTARTGAGSSTRASTASSSTTRISRSGSWGRGRRPRGARALLAAMAPRPHRRSSPRRRPSPRRGQRLGSKPT